MVPPSNPVAASGASLAGSSLPASLLSGSGEAVGSQRLRIFGPRLVPGASEPISAPDSARGTSAGQAAPGAKGSLQSSRYPALASEAAWSKEFAMQRDALEEELPAGIAPNSAAPQAQPTLGGSNHDAAARERSSSGVARGGIPVGSASLDSAAQSEIGKTLSFAAQRGLSQTGAAKPAASAAHSTSPAVAPSPEGEKSKRRGRAALEDPKLYQKPDQGALAGSAALAAAATAATVAAPVSMRADSIGLPGGWPGENRDSLAEAAATAGHAPSANGTEVAGVGDGAVRGAGKLDSGLSLGAGEGSGIAARRGWAAVEVGLAGPISGREGKKFAGEVAEAAPEHATALPAGTAEKGRTAGISSGSGLESGAEAGTAGVRAGQATETAGAGVTSALVGGMAGNVPGPVAGQDAGQVAGPGHIPAQASGRTGQTAGRTGPEDWQRVGLSAGSQDGTGAIPVDPASRVPSGEQGTQAPGATQADRRGRERSRAEATISALGTHVGAGALVQGSGQTSHAGLSGGGHEAAGQAGPGQFASLTLAAASEPGASLVRGAHPENRAGESSRDPFAAMDAGSGAGPGLRADGMAASLGGRSSGGGGRSLEVGYQDSTLGYVELRAQMGQGGVHAALVASTPGAEASLASSLGALSGWLDARHIPVESLTVVGQGAGNAGSMGSVGGGSGGGGEGGTAGHPGERSSSGQPETTPDFWNAAPGKAPESSEASSMPSVQGWGLGMAAVEDSGSEPGGRGRGFGSRISLMA
jgi:hypothetical protein